MRWRRGSRRKQVDVVVVGAGFAGLAAADRLVASGLDVLVLEEADRVGGRTWTVQGGGTWLELGGMWTGPGQPLLAGLVDRFGLGTFPQHDEGRALLVEGGTALADDVSDARWAAIDRYVAALDDLARTVPADGPWRAPGAEALDALTLDRWLVQEVPDPEARHHLEVVLTELMCVPAEELSVLTLLHAAVTSGTLAAALGVQDGAQERRVLHGIQAAALALADELGDRVRLGSGVDRLSWNDAGAIVDLADGSVMARHVVVAMAPSTCERIDFEPVLPLRRVDAQRRMPLGSVVKVCAVYDRPFWRDAGLSGSVLDLDGPFHHCLDVSSPDSDRGVLVSFLAAEAARELSDAALGAGASDVRRARFLERAVAWFGPEAAQPLHYRDLDWTSVPPVGGGYSGVVEPGAWPTIGPSLTAPVGCLHWAGSESASTWTGYVEGALSSGIRAADEVLASRGLTPRS